MQMMQLNVTTDYAIRTVLYLAIKDELATSNEIAMAMGIPPSYVFKNHQQAGSGRYHQKNSRGTGPAFCWLKSQRRSAFTKSSMCWRRLQSLTVVWRSAGIAAVLLLKIVRYGPFTVSYRA